MQSLLVPRLPLAHVVQVVLFGLGKAHLNTKTNESHDLISRKRSCVALKRNTTVDHISECAALCCLFVENMLG